MATPSKKSGSRGPASTPETPERPEQLVSGDTGTTVINGTTFAGKRLTYAKVDELAIFEGDIVLGRHADLEGSGDRDSDIAFAVAITGSHLRWPNATVPYEIDPAMPDQFRVTDAIAHWLSNTPVKFVLRTAANAGTYPNYVRFFAGGGCYSTVGMVGGRQDISLGTGCSTGNAIHEIGHTVGLWHEQSREDRDSFVTVNFANVDPSKVHNFDQHIADGDDIGGYDYGSIMHYPANAFSINGQPTIVPLQAGVTIGQRNGLSAGDIAAVRQLYPTGTVSVKKLLDDGGTGGFKKIRDDNFGGFKKFRDDQVVPFKKIRDDVIVTKPVFDPPKGFDNPGQVVVNPGQVVNPAGGGDLPFILANPHHAAAAAAYEAGAGVDPTTALLQSAAQSAAVAAQAMAEVAAALDALLGTDGQGG